MQSLFCRGAQAPANHQETRNGKLPREILTCTKLDSTPVPIDLCWEKIPFPPPPFNLVIHM